jgi:F-type H+-transporting ATPase subunit b
MDFFTHTLDTVSITVSDLSMTLNPDIFETNVINITILLGGIVYLGSNALSASLVERQKKILESIQEAEERLQQAVTRLAESEKQLEQSQLVIASIKSEAQTTAQQIKSAILEDGKLEIARLTSSAKSQVGTIEAKVRKQISDYVVALALKRVTLQLESSLSTNLQQQIIDTNISKLID